MAKIRQMDAQLSNMIAAGEVVERPSGIVKELVENAIDAKATRIEIHTIDGGISKIEVIDNGSGMDETDVLLAFKRHATSKIQTTDDLWNISTLGFRGEALPSIASVSKTTLISNDGNTSNSVIVNYGDVSEVIAYPSTKGTTVIVEGLFTKTPARLKHLKSTNYESSVIQDVVNKFALSHTEISFRLVMDQKEVLKTSGQGNLKEVMVQIYGKELLKNSFLIEGEDFDFSISGYGSLPSVTRANRNYINVFVNGRMIKSYRLTKAIVDGYKGYLFNERYPIVVLNIKMDEKIVDVNVHPSKWEIRLSKEQQLEYLIKDVVVECLKKQMQVPEVSKVVVSNETVYQPTFDVQTNIQKVDDEIKVTKDFVLEVKEEVEVYPEVHYEEVVKPERTFPNMEALAQLHGKYILASGIEGLYIIDQHAAQERVNYEKFIDEFNNVESSMIDLLIPVSVNASSNCIRQLSEFNSLMKKLNLEFEEFSNNTLIVRSVPMWMSGLDEAMFLQDLVDEYGEKDFSKVELNDHTLATKACHASIRFNRVLSKIEMDEVITSLKNCKQPYHCPHGRPTFILISESQLVRDFKR